MDKWIGKYAVIVGASSGIGEVIAKKFAENGINVIALARRVEKIEENIKNYGEISGKIHPRQCDISNQDSINETFKWIGENFSEINILVNNAAVGLFISLLSESEESTNAINNTINTNLTGVVHCTRKAVGLMKKHSNPSIIINISSTLAHRIPFTGHSFNIYPPTKYAVRAFNEIVRQELINEGASHIKTSCISPGLVATPMPSEQLLQNYAHLQPEDIADAALYLLSTPPRVNILDIIVQNSQSII